MKKFLNKDKSNFLYGMLIAVLCGIIFTACQKNNAKPAAPPPAQPVPINTGPTLTTQEQQLVGYWILDSSIVYQNNNRLSVHTIGTSSISCKLELQSGYYLNQSAQNDKKEAFNGIECNVAEYWWKAPNQGYLDLGLTYPILLLTTNNLYISQTSGQSTEVRYYFHK